VDKPQPKLIKHANHIVVVHSATHADLIDPVTGHWQSYTSQRAAKWWGSVRRRLEEGFGHKMADDVQLELFVRNQPKE
jgi:hypothetical protein